VVRRDKKEIKKTFLATEVIPFVSPFHSLKAGSAI
jgi:hypothetical protein